VLLNIQGFGFKNRILGIQILNLCFQIKSPLLPNLY